MDVKDKNYQAIVSFLNEHHVLNLATYGARLWCCSMFYALDSDNGRLIVASDPKTEHMENVAVNHTVSGTVVLETEEVGKIQGIQWYGTMNPLFDKNGEMIYFGRFPYARAMLPQLWEIELLEVKLTDNRLGFGKKLIWKREISA